MEIGQPAGLGLVLHQPGRRPIFGFAVIPNDVLVQLQVRTQQINQAEALACLLGPHNWPEAFRGRDVMHYVDNTSALTGCIKGGSGVEDSNCIFQLHALQLAELSCRYWVEFVESAANPADEPSRLLGPGSVSCSLGAAVHACSLPPLAELRAAGLLDLAQSGLQTHLD